jgi:hypothetical protein
LRNLKIPKFAIPNSAKPEPIRNVLKIPPTPLF